MRQRRAFAGIELKYSHFVTAVYNVSMSIVELQANVEDYPTWAQKILAQKYRVP